MKSKEEIEKLCDAMVNAEFEYKSAIRTNISEYKKEILVKPNIDANYFLITIKNEDGFVDLGVDKVRWNEEQDYIEYHIVKYDFLEDLDEWKCIDELYEGEIDCILDNIDWNSIR